MTSQPDDISPWWAVSFFSIINFPLGTILCIIAFLYFQRESSRAIRNYAQMKRGVRSVPALKKWFLAGIIATPILFPINTPIFSSIIYSMMGTTEEEIDAQYKRAENLREKDKFCMSLNMALNVNTGECTMRPKN